MRDNPTHKSHVLIKHSLYLSHHLLLQSSLSMHSSSFSLPVGPPGHGPSSRLRRDGRPHSFAAAQLGVEAYVPQTSRGGTGSGGGVDSNRYDPYGPQSSRQRIHELKQQVQQIHSHHHAQWGSVGGTGNGIGGTPSIAWRGTTPTPPVTQHEPIPVSYHAAAPTAAAGAHYDHQPTQPTTHLQPRPPTMSQPTTRKANNGASHQQMHQPRASTSSGRITSSRSHAPHTAATTRPSPDTPSPPMSPDINNVHSSPTSSASGGGGSLQDKVSAALADLENIKSNRYHTRPNTTASSTTGMIRDPVLPRPQIRSGSAAASSATAADPSHDSNLRTEEELRTAKTILRKLYKKNIQLASDIKKLRAGVKLEGPRSPSEKHQLNLDEHEAKLLATQAQDGAGEEDDDADADANMSLDGPHTTMAFDDDENVSPESSSPSQRRVSSSTISSSKSKTKKVKNGIGGSSHLLFLLGERDTTINRLQAQVQSLTRRANSYAAKLEVIGGGGGVGGSSSVVGAESTAPSDGLFSDLASEMTHSQFDQLRATLAERLRGQMSQMAYMESMNPTTHGGGQQSSSYSNQQQQQQQRRRLDAYIRDLEKWLIWEASWRQVEKVALNAQCMKAEKHAQDSWVRSRLLERELQDSQQRYHSLDSKLRLIDTQLAASLEKNRQLEVELMKIKKKEMNP